MQCCITLCAFILLTFGTLYVDATQHVRICFYGDVSSRVDSCGKDCYVHTHKITAKTYNDKTFERQEFGPWEGQTRSEGPRGWYSYNFFECCTCSELTIGGPIKCGNISIIGGIPSAITTAVAKATACPSLKVDCEACAKRKKTIERIRYQYLPSMRSILDSYKEVLANPDKWRGKTFSNVQEWIFSKAKQRDPDAKETGEPRFDFDCPPGFPQDTFNCTDCDIKLADPKSESVCTPSEIEIVTKICWEHERAHGEDMRETYEMCKRGQWDENKWNEYIGGQTTDWALVMRSVKNEIAQYEQYNIKLAEEWLRKEMSAYEKECRDCDSAKGSRQ